LPNAGKTFTKPIFANALEVYNAIWVKERDGPDALFEIISKKKLDRLSCMQKVASTIDSPMNIHCVGNMCIFIFH
jgi:hypothetical protein